MSIENLIETLEKAKSEDVYLASDQLADIDSVEIVDAMLSLLKNSGPEARFLASRTLGKMTNNSAALVPLLEAINDKANAEIAGDLMMALQGFDVSETYVDIFKLYLFGSFKVSKIAKELLDYKEYNITPRVVKKANKHWNHYSNNVKQDDAFELRKIEVVEMLTDLSNFINDSS